MVLFCPPQRCEFYKERFVFQVLRGFLLSCVVYMEMKVCRDLKFLIYLLKLKTSSSVVICYIYIISIHHLLLSPHGGWRSMTGQVLFLHLFLQLLFWVPGQSSAPCGGSHALSPHTAHKVQSLASQS